MWAGLKGTFAEEIKKAVPEWKTSYFDYEFDSKKAIYKPGRESGDKPTPFSASVANDNEVFSDFANDKYIAQKHVFDKTFLIEDSLQKRKMENQK